MTTDPFEATAASGTEPDREVLVAGMQLGKYKLLRILGEGGMGVVWAARDPDLERSIAIKLLRNHRADAEQRARLLREARAMARLKHANVLTVYEVDSDGDRDYLVMELVDGRSLHAWLETKPPYDDIWRAVIAAGRGLAAAHAADLVHRDFKPHNVLRSDVGRILVTDFGLARGLGDDPTGGRARAITIPPTPTSASDVTIEATPPRKPDSVLDSTLTQPGALMGTPAYMAPEQYLGAPPDPRTDQFAFCVTAWQALAGERPFRGTSIGELKVQCAAGVADVDAKLPRAVRAVLARGLSPDPEDRWPSLDALLDALEAAGQIPRRRRARMFVAFGLVMAAILVVAMMRREDRTIDTAPSACESREQAFAGVWTTERQDAFAQRAASDPNAQVIVTAVNQFRDAWLERYVAACTAGSSAKATARISCLRGERDDLDGFLRVAETMPASALQGIDLFGIVPQLDMCASDSPVSPPLLPEDRVKRDEIARLRAEAAKRRTDELDLMKHADELLGRARKIGWKPLVPELEVMIGTAAQTLGDLDQARTMLEAAADDAERLAAFEIEAKARIALLDLESRATADPTDAQRANRLIDKARGAIELAGNDPALVDAVDILIARLDMMHGQVDHAIDTLERTRGKLIAAGALNAASAATADEIAALELRGNSGDLDTAWQRGRDTETAIAASHRTVARSSLPSEMTSLAWLRGDLDETHARADKSSPGHASATPVTGRVTGPDGKPAAHAHVVAWHGALAGDRSRIYTRPGRADAITTTGADGAFTIEVPPGDLVMAELDELRSGPVEVRPSHLLVVALGPTHAIAGSVESTGSINGVDAFVRVAVGPTSTWTVRATLAPDRTFRIAGIPAIAATVGARGTGRGRESKEVVGGPARDGVRVHWPSGPAIDVIVRAADSSTWVTVLRGHHVPATREELERRQHADHDVAFAQPTPIGLEDATLAGQSSYAKDDRHLVVDDNDPGDVTICAQPDHRPPACTAATLTSTPVVVVLPATR